MGSSNTSRGLSDGLDGRSSSLEGVSLGRFSMLFSGFCGGVVGPSVELFKLESSDEVAPTRNRGDVSDTFIAGGCGVGREF